MSGIQCSFQRCEKKYFLTPAQQQALLARRLPGAAFGQIGSELEWFCRRYRPQPRVYIAYDRLAYAGIDDPDLRITFDTYIRWRTEQPELRCGDWGQPLLPDDRVLLELKLPGACPLWLSHALSDIGAYPVSFSKYGYCYKEYILPTLQNNKKEAQHCA